jgi:hypothetical protein
MKVLHHRHSFAIADIESSILGTLSSQSLDKTLSIGVVRMVWSGDLDTHNELLETQALAVGKPMARGECVWLPTSTKELEREGYEVSGLVHSTR